MVSKYPNLLSPLKVGNVVLRNKLTALVSKPHFIQGPEPYPTEGLITHFANKAKNGAAMVTCQGFTGMTGYTGYVLNNFDIHNPPVWKYYLTCNLLGISVWINSPNEEF